MKKIFVLIIAIILCFAGCTNQNDYDNDAQQPLNQPLSDNTSVKSVWLAYYELESLTKGKSEAEFRSLIGNALNNISDAGFNTVTVQVRPCADALYKSDYFPVSQYFQGEQGSELIYDPLAIICEIAQSCNLSVEAWVNPYRVSQNDNVKKLSESNIAKEWLDSNNVKIVNKKIYFNPASDEVQNLIINGVREIAENYPVSAIHFDDYFYPTTDKGFDKEEYDAYRKKDGEMSLADWRRSNVSTLIRNVYKTIKNVNCKIRFGISPAGSIDENYSKLYADVELWCSKKGYIDYICPQIYFGFKNEKMPFMLTVKKWVSLVDTSIVDLYVGLPLYKAGKIDEYASSENESAKNEFKENTDIISRQITYLSKIDDVSGFYIYSYSSFADDSNKEVKGIRSVMQSSNLL